MSKAEDKLENNRLKYIDYTFKRHGIDPDSKEGQLIYYAYGHGYHQAEKDLKLTWELEYIKYQLELRLPETLDYNGVQVDREDFINDFIKAMKDEYDRKSS